MGAYVEAEAWLASRTGYGRRRYRAYVPHPLSSWQPLLDAEASRAVMSADRALIGTAARQQADLAGSLADWMTARDESIRTSVMEGVDATASGLEWARYLDRAGEPVSDDNDALTLGASKQIAAAIELGQRMRAGDAATLEDMLALHDVLFSGTRDRDIGGVLRDEPIWVGPPGCLIDDATFVAPPADFVHDLMEDLIGYVNDSDHPAILKTAVAHAQFEIIHPFEDGNGRTGRALMHTVLAAAGLTRSAIPLSAALSSDVPGYHAALNAARCVCDPEDSRSRSAAMKRWLTVFSRACEESEQHSAAIAEEVDLIIGRWQHATRFRRGSAARELMEALPSMPVLDAQMVAARLSTTDRAARRALDSLQAVGIVEPTGGKRNRRYAVPDMVRLLRRMTPDGGYAPDAGAAFMQAQEMPRAPSLIPCRHEGARSKRPCLLPYGHKGQHRYT